MRHHVDDVVDDVGVVVVQRDETVVPLERLETLAALAEPRVVATRERFLVAGEVAADVVEDAVEQDPQATPTGLGDEMIEVGVITEARVDPEWSLVS